MLRRINLLFKKSRSKLSRLNRNSNSGRTRRSETFELSFEKLEDRMMLDGAAMDVIFQAGFEDVFVERGGYGFYQEVSGFTATGAPVEVQHNHPSVGPAVEGDQHLELDGVNGIWVDIAAASNPELLLRFEFSPRRGVSAEQSAIDVYWDGNLIETVMRDGSKLRSTDFQEVEIELPAIDGATGRLEFRSASPGDEMGLGGLIDDVRVFKRLGPIELAEIPDHYFAMGEEFDLNASLLPPNQNLSGAVYSLVDGPVGMQIDSATGEISWIASQHNIDASDSRNDQTIIGDPELVFQAGFEDANVESGGYGFFAEVSGFHSILNAVEIQHNHSSVGKASEGSQLLELDGLNGVYRDVTTTSGDRYELVLDYSARSGVGEIGNAIEVWWGGVLLDTITADGRRQRGTDFNEYRFDLSGFTGDMTRLELRSNDPDDEQGLGGLVDNVRLLRRTVDVIDGPNGKYNVVVRVTGNHDFLVKKSINL